MKLNNQNLMILDSIHIKILERLEIISKNHSYISGKIFLKQIISQNHFKDLLAQNYITHKEGHYKLSLNGMDALAILSLKNSGLKEMGNNIGIGKESDIYLGKFKNELCAIKIFRLGRTSFKKQILEDNKSWYEANKERCKKEVENINKLKNIKQSKNDISKSKENDDILKFDILENNISNVLAFNRHVLVLEYFNYETLYKIKIQNYELIGNKMMNFISTLYDLGYVHGDFNEFNVMVKGNEIKVIDFSQMVSIEDPKADENLKRDIKCTIDYFKRKYNLILENKIY